MDAKTSLAVFDLVYTTLGVPVTCVMVYYFLVFPVTNGIRWAFAKRVSAHWMWFGVLYPVLFPWIVWAAIRWLTVARCACPSCGRTVPLKMQFCAKCGERLSAEALSRKNSGAELPELPAYQGGGVLELLVAVVLYGKGLLGGLLGYEIGVLVGWALMFQRHAAAPVQSVRDAPNSPFGVIMFCAVGGSVLGVLFPLAKWAKGPRGTLVAAKSSPVEPRAAHAGVQVSKNEQVQTDDGALEDFFNSLR